MYSRDTTLRAALRNQRRHPQAAVLGQAAGDVHALHRLAGCAADEVVDRADYQPETIVLADVYFGVVRPANVRDIGRFIDDADEGRVTEEVTIGGGEVDIAG